MGTSVLVSLQKSADLCSTQSVIRLVLAGLESPALSSTTKETKEPMYSSGGSDMGMSAGSRCAKLLATGFAKALYL